MFSTMDKALAALVMATLYIWNAFAPWKVGITPEMVQTILGILTPIVVYLVPNKPSE